MSFRRGKKCWSEEISDSETGRVDRWSERRGEGELRGMIMGCTKDLVDEAGDRIGRGVVGLEVKTRLTKDQEEERALEGEIFRREVGCGAGDSESLRFLERRWDEEVKMKQPK